MMEHVIDALDMDLQTLSSDERQKRQDQITRDRLLVSLKFQGSVDPRFQAFKDLLQNQGKGSPSPQDLAALIAAAEQRKSRRDTGKSKSKSMRSKNKDRNVFMVPPNELKKYKVQKSESIQRRRKAVEEANADEEKRQDK
jgi:hypothetical protein